MNLGIDWSQASTKRGAIWVAVSITALVFYWFGKDPLPVMAVGSGLAGGLGLAVKD
jgi:hypothetical protein